MFLFLFGFHAQSVKFHAHFLGHKADLLPKGSPQQLLRKLPAMCEEILSTYGMEPWTFCDDFFDDFSMASWASCLKGVSWLFFCACISSVCWS